MYIHCSHYAEGLHFSAFHLDCGCAHSVPLVSQGHMASSEAPCDPPEVSRAFQSEAMANDPSRKYECKPCKLCRSTLRILIKYHSLFFPTYCRFRPHGRYPVRAINDIQEINVYTCSSAFRIHACILHYCLWLQSRGARLSGSARLLWFYV